MAAQLSHFLFSCLSPVPPIMLKMRRGRVISSEVCHMMNLIIFTAAGCRRLTENMTWNPVSPLSTFHLIRHNRQAEERHRIFQPTWNSCYMWCAENCCAGVMSIFVVFPPE